jgi:hypothetical protein
MAHPRTIRAARALALSLALSACSHDYHLMKMEEQLNSYAGAIRWSLFKKSLEFHEHPPSPLPDWKALRDIKVTYYQPLFRDTLSDGNLVLQTVEIKYIHGYDMVERSITEEQRWRYDEDRSRWLLQTGFPKFK